ncbi:hypothetical protein FTO74_13840 [Granulicella sp. WH15]|uniref:glycosyl hydrolase family 28-related protein n=1 Tax=Granulicella sp. WH15 TaxID=2602070 RepID=UPI0013678263|nr:glycosyl hydrolase family 28-related protein [Granulicella sp. WH15]QHN04323.1 hypothetical protein FTO74_13840 [Granulicella sp. WH15]
MARLSLGRSILDFGGVGDGKTDNALAFQKAMKALSAAGGGTLLVPAGLYVTSATLVFSLPVPITIRGDSSKTSIIHYVGKGDAIFVGPQVVSVKQHLYVHLTLSSLGLTGTAVSSNGIHIVDASEFFLKDLIVSGFGRDGMRASASQYGHISDTTFAANGAHGLNFSIGILKDGRGVIQNNTWELNNVYFMANQGWGYRDQDGFGISCHNCTFQSNRAGGSLETADTDDEVGEPAPGVPTTGIQPSNNIYENCHWEWNSNINQYIQFGQRIRTVEPLYASTSAANGDWIIGSHASTGMVLEQPFWLSVGPHIVIYGGDHHRVDTGGVPVTLNHSTHSYFYFGSEVFSDSSAGPSPK